MTRLDLPDDDDDMTKNNKEEGYVRVLSFLDNHMCEGVRVFWNHRHIVIRARNSFTFIRLSNDDQSMTMAAGTPFRLSSAGAASPATFIRPQH
jgi:hypothetical protein